MRVDDLAIRNLTHIPLDRPFGNELEDRIPKVFRRAGMSYISTVGSDDDKKWGTDFVFSCDGALVRLDVTASFGGKDHMVELGIDPLEIWSTKLPEPGEEPAPLATIHFGVRFGNACRGFAEGVLVMGINTGARYIRYKNELDELIDYMCKAARMIRKCLLEAGRMVLVA